MHAHRIHVFNEANRDHLVFRVANHLQFQLFPTHHRFLDQHLSHHAGGQPAADHEPQFLADNLYRYLFETVRVIWYEAPPDADVVAQIKDLIETRVRPAVANDGGDFIFKRFDVDTGIVHLTVRGACSGCPSSTLTLKQGVENLLRHYVPEVTAVEAAA